MTGTLKTNGTNGTNDSENAVVAPNASSSEVTPMDNAIRDLIVKLRPYKLTKAELVMILNLGLGVPSGESAAATENGNVNGDGAMDVDDAQVNSHGEEYEEGEAGEEEEDGSAMALFDTVIEEREGRMSDEDVLTILGIVRETLDQNYGN